MGTTAELATLQGLMQGTSGVVPVIPEAPNPRYRYLVGAIKGSRPTILVLAYVDPHPQGPVEVWASGTGEVIKLQNGRIVATAGLKTDWLAVRMQPQPVAWDKLPEQGQQFVRERDVMPGYHFNVAEHVSVTRWTRQLPANLPSTLPQSVAQKYRWFRESSEGATGAGLPEAWFAWGKHLGEWGVVYSEQCLAVDFCLLLQRWPVKDEAN